MTAYGVDGLIAAAALAGVAGDFSLKRASMRDAGAPPGPFALGTGLDVLAAPGWMIALRSMPMATVGVAYAAAMLAPIAPPCALAFGKRRSARECLGVACAVAAVALTHRWRRTAPGSITLNENLGQRQKLHRSATINFEFARFVFARGVWPDSRPCREPRFGPAHPGGSPGAPPLRSRCAASARAAAS